MFALIDSHDPISEIPGLDDTSAVLATSPRRDILKEYHKLVPEPIVFFMPLWSRQELEYVAKNLYPERLRDWAERYDLLGGVARYVLQHVAQEPRQIISRAIKSCSLDDCIRIVGQDSVISSSSNVLQTLVHLHSEPPYTSTSVQFASKAIMDMLAREKVLISKEKIETVLSSLTDNPLSASLGGHIFQHHAIEMLSKGGEFKYRKLVHGNVKEKPQECTLHIPPSDPVIVDGVEPDQKLDQLYVPRTKNYAGIDAWMPGKGAFQITVARTHQINGQVVSDLNKLPAEARRLYFVLPPGPFKIFTEKPPRSIEQYALKMPYPEPRDM